MDEKPLFNDLSRRAFEICLAIYRVANLLPAGEVLVERIKELASEIAAEIGTAKRNSAKIEKLIIYLRLAQAQDWLNPINFEVLIKEYQKLEMSLREEIPRYCSGQAPQSSPRFKHGIASVASGRPRNDTFRITERQKKILSLIKEKKEAQMKDFLNVFNSQVTERTLRNDLKVLVKEGRIRKQGEFKATKYFI